MEGKIKLLIVYALAQSNDSFAESGKWRDIEIKLITLGVGFAVQLILNAFPVTRESSAVISAASIIYQGLNSTKDKLEFAQKLIEIIFILLTAQTEEEIKEQGKTLAELVLNSGFDPIIDAIDILNNLLVTSIAINSFQNIVKQLNELTKYVFSQPVKVAY